MVEKRVKLKLGGRAVRMRTGGGGAVIGDGERQGSWRRSAVGQGDTERANAAVGDVNAAQKDEEGETRAQKNGIEQQTLTEVEAKANNENNGDERKHSQPPPGAVEAATLDESADGRDGDDHHDNDDGDAVLEKLGVNGAVATGDKHRGAVVSVVWDGADCFATAGADHIARIYQLHPSSNNNPRSTRLIREWTPFHSNTALAGLVSSSPAHDYQHPHDNSDHRARLLLAFGASPQAIVCSWRDGNQLCATPRGDMYAFDSRNTAGHSAAITAAAWTAPRFVTASRDATLRVWEFAGSCSAAARQVRVVRLRAGGTASSRLLPDAIAATPTSLVAVGCANSSIRVYDLRAHGDRACETIPRAVNAGGDELVSMAFAPDDAHQLLARSTDDCLRLWDIRRVDHPLVCHSNLPSSPPPLASPCLFIHRAPFCSPSSPSSSLSLYATAAAGAGGFAGAKPAHNRNELVKRSRLVLFSRATLELVAEAYVGEPRGNITALCDAARCLMLGCADGTTLQCNSTAATLNAERNRDETICVKSASVQAARQVKDGSSSASPGMQRRRKQHDAVIAKAELPIFAAHEIPAAMRALKKRKHPHASPSTE